MLRLLDCRLEAGALRHAHPVRGRLGYGRRRQGYHRPRFAPRDPAGRITRRKWSPGRTSPAAGAALHCGKSGEAAMANDGPKSAFELAMERLRKQDADEGVVERTLTDEQK